MPKNIAPLNHKGEPHGYWESYHPNGQLRYKGTYLNGQKHGLWGGYRHNGNLAYKGTYHYGKKIGYWVKHNKTLFYA
jgi:antitoxin component YwqK of YwqJK toxin-antitoxin module